MNSVNLAQRLYDASAAGNTQEVVSLLSIGADVNQAQPTGWTALMFAAYYGFSTTVQTLLQHGANTSAAPRGGETALILAAKNGHIAVVEVLLKAGANRNAADKDGMTSLMFAADKGHAALVKVLLQAGTDLHQKDQHGATAWHLAESKGHKNVCMLLRPSQLASSTSPDPWADLGKTAGKGLQNILRVGYHFAKEITSDPASSITKPASEKSPEPADNAAALGALLAEMDGMVGLEAVKAEVVSHISLLRVQKMRREKGLTVPNQSLHMVFSGSPGTGKTSIARLLAKIYREMGILSKGTFTETDRSGLVGQYVGHTAEKVQQVVRKSLGGVLFIDEAYSLSAGEDSFGREAIDTLLKLMEDNRDNLIVIVAGYAEQMEQFVESNPGLRSRFNKFLHFEDYTPDELVAIFLGLSKQNDYAISDGAHKKLHVLFAGFYRARTQTFANGRLVRNTFEKAISKHAVRISGLSTVTSEELTLLEASDIS